MAKTRNKVSDILVTLKPEREGSVSVKIGAATKLGIFHLKTFFDKIEEVTGVASFPSYVIDGERNIDLWSYGANVHPSQMPIVFEKVKAYFEQQPIDVVFEDKLNPKSNSVFNLKFLGFEIKINKLT